MTQARPLHVGIAGASGVVGQEFLALLERRGFPIASLRLFGSSRSAGRALRFADQEIIVEELAGADPTGLDLVLFSAGKGVAREQAPRFAEAGAIVVDNSSAFRDDAAIPLIVPEINGAELSGSRARIIANPNCSTIILLMALAPLHRALGLDEVVVSTYQAVSGAGRPALDDLFGQTRAYVQGEAETWSHYDRPIFLNLIPKIGELDEAGDCGEESKIVHESHRILGDDRIRIYATTVRVPVERCHSESVFVRARQATDLQEVTRLLSTFPGVRLMDLPSPRELIRREETFVGRLRVDPDDPRVLRFWVVSDQLWKGAALNAIQIAEALIAAGRFSG
jgi:aspartate-semialdehyde dehydrogenase